jgi:hypothetical protein
MGCAGWGMAPGPSTFSDCADCQATMQTGAGFEPAADGTEREVPFDIIGGPARAEGRVRQGGRKERGIRFLRMKPGHGEVLLAEGDPRLREDEERLISEFRRQLDEGMWAAVPTTAPGNGRREALLIKTYGEIPEGAERVIFFPRAAGG